MRPWIRALRTSDVKASITKFCPHSGKIILGRRLGHRRLNVPINFLLGYRFSLVTMNILLSDDGRSYPVNVLFAQILLEDVHDRTGVAVGNSCWIANP